ncbi:MAG: hypothetical protein KIH69_023755 [Anaerolineae bacterium]|nr:hypothetical protein [Anaerolineae bacterium]
MDLQKFLNSKLGQAFLGIWMVHSIITIFRAGHSFGQWLYRLLN